MDSPSARSAGSLAHHPLQETQHEKITRGIAMALSLIMYNREDEADTLIEVLCSHKVSSRALDASVSLAVPSPHLHSQHIPLIPFPTPAYMLPARFRLVVLWHLMPARASICGWLWTEFWSLVVACTRCTKCLRDGDSGAGVGGGGQ